MFGFMNVLFVIVFILASTVIIFAIVKGITIWNKNNNSPKLTVPAKIVAKRQNTAHSHHHNAGDITGAHGYYTTSSTTYYVTFQFESGDRTELHVPSSEYGFFVEGDEGKLTFQGTRYLSFERKRYSD
ncbi:MAG: DUF2500 domain-containing protein [Clostridia bacterium]|nr:DUF2500 domain-containing protein [Clostridia bacterium]